MREEFAPHLLESRTLFVEPMYKAAFSSKGMLPLLWEYFPGHPNLLECHRSQRALSSYARKPVLSREGQNVRLVQDGEIIAETQGDYADEGFIYQALCPLPAFGGVRPVIGSWVIAGTAAGIGIRESDGLITTDQSHFIPHFFE